MTPGVALVGFEGVGEGRWDYQQVDASCVGVNDVSVRSVCIVSICGLSGSVCVRACLECDMCQVCVWHVCARAVCGGLGKDGS